VIDDRQQVAVKAAAQKVLSVRAEFLAPGAPVSDPARTKKRPQRAGSEIGGCWRK
jgi:hypothetical protein